ncbi:hypothetical protein [Liberiplasma polymorphum]|uniref:hypothetical protein n=1 Tax=Liberiplasma polymorphum TaxID=3374570 RepID=UPI0037738384
MKKLFLFVLGFTLFFSLSLFNETTVEASWADVSVTLTSYFEDDDKIPHTPEVRAYGSTFAFDSNIDSNPNYRFAFWIWNGVVRADLPVDHEFIIRSTTDLVAVFAPVASEGPQPVVAAFVDTNGVLIDLQYVLSGSVADDPTLEVGYDAPTKPKYLQSEVSPWGQSLEAITEDTVYVVNYEINPASQFDLVVNNGTGGGVDIAYNTIVTVTADAPGVGEYFAGWQVNNVLVSYDKEYSFSLLGDKTITALYSETEVTKEPLVSLSPDLELTTAKKSFLAQFSLPAGYTLIEYGMIRSNEPSSLTFASADNVFLGTVYTSETKEFLMTFTAEFGSIAAYLTYKDSLDVIHTVYSRSYHYGDLEFTYLDFETGSKVGSIYAEGTYTIDGNVWGLYEAGIGNLVGDIKVNSRSLRVRDGYIQSNFIFYNGIDNLFFLHAIAGFAGDSAGELFVEYAYEWAPNTWNRLKDGASDYIINVNSTNLEQAIVPVNISDPIRIRILQETSDGNRLSIDSFIVNYSQYVDDVLPTLYNVPATATITEGDEYIIPINIYADDNIDGDLTNDISIVVRDSDEEIIESYGDFRLLPAGEYTINYTVEDSSNNLSTSITTLTILDPSEVQIIVIDFEKYPNQNIYSGLNDFDDGLLMQFGNAVSSASPVYGTMHGLLRVANGTTNVPYLQYGATEYDITKIKFQARVTNVTNYQVIVQFSTDGDSWGTPVNVTGLTTSYSTTPFEATSNVVGARHIRISFSYSATAGSHRDMLIDDINLLND